MLSCCDTSGSVGSQRAVRHRACPPKQVWCTLAKAGGMAEWSMAVVLKTVLSPIHDSQLRPVFAFLAAIRSDRNPVPSVPSRRCLTRLLHNSLHSALFSPLNDATDRVRIKPASVSMKVDPSDSK